MFAETEKPDQALVALMNAKDVNLNNDSRRLLRSCKKKMAVTKSGINTKTYSEDQKEKASELIEIITEVSERYTKS